MGACGVAGALALIASCGTQPARPSLAEAVAAAWARLPQRDNFAAERTTAGANYVAGSAVFPNAPSLSGLYANDRIAGSNVGYITGQAQLSTPIWLPGEGTAKQRVAEAEEEAARGDEAAAHLTLAAEVLDLATQAAIAEDSRAVAASRLATADLLAHEAAARYSTGESAESDELAASAAAETARLDATDAATRLDTARAAFASLTGMEMLPDLTPAGVLNTVGSMSRNPRLIAADNHVTSAREQVRLVRLQNRDDPEIGLQVINDKQPGTRWDTRVAVMFTLPFATEARNAPRRAAAEQVLTEALVQREVTRREIDLAIRQAESEYAGAMQDKQSAVGAASALRKRRAQIRHAWELGEMPLIELVRADDSAFDAAFAADRANTKLAAARWKLMIARGAVP